MKMDKERLLDALKTVRYPGNGKNIVEAGIVSKDDLRIEGNKVMITLTFDRPTDPFHKSVVKAVEAAVITHISTDIDIKGNVVAKFRNIPEPKTETPLKGVSNIIGVSSGKGGVGKSTIASNLAVALAAEGYAVGLLDADIFGPSVPKMLGTDNEQLYIHQVDGHNLIIPTERYGVRMLSIGYLVDPASAVIWRGAMASNALKQLITETDWGDLDYFIIDMPPGTSDIHLTLVQTLPLTGAIVVTTPQEVALADARKGISMFREEKINVPVIGLVENMAWFTPERHSDERYYIFGQGGADKLSKEFGVPVLARIPVTEKISEGGDKGMPIALDNTSLVSGSFIHLAREVVDAVDRRNRELPPTLPVDTHK